MVHRGFDAWGRLSRSLHFGLWLLVASGLNAQSTLQTERAPTGWFLAGRSPAGYRTGVDRAETHGGLPSGYLASSAKSGGFGTLMQSISAANYAGKRVRLRGWVKSQDVGDWAGLWMRVDKGRETVAFDNMQDRGIKGAQPWSIYDVVLDVPADATSINFGILLNGAGEVWLNGLSLDVVEVDTPTTGTVLRTILPQRPVNLRFEE
jgi:hypothetical protein